MRPVNRTRKVFIIILSVILLSVLALFAGRYILFNKIRSDLHSRLDSLRQEGIDVKFKSADINVWNGQIEVYELQLNIEDSANENLQLTLPYLIVKEIGILPFILDNTLNIGTISLQQPTITYRQSSKFIKNKSRQKALLQNLNIDNLELPGVVLYLKDTLNTDTLAHISGDLNIKTLGMFNQHDSLAWDNGDISISNVDLKLPNDMYTCAIKKAQLSLERKTLRIDSLKISPMYNRKNFMRKMGKETDRVGGVVSYLTIDNIKFSGKPYPLLDAGVMKLSINFSIYRDKRYPFKKDFNTSLPSHFIQRLPIQLRADTIILDDSYISYEEFPEEGDSTGRIYFDDLHAKITGVHNNATIREDIILKAKARFMGAGDLFATFTFPYDTTKPYKATGSLQNLPLVALNDMLGSAAKARIESGTMTNLKFNFQYNMLKSDGEVELNYENLRISSLRENRKNEQAVSLIKTLLLNTFIVRRDMDEDVSDDKKTGKVSFYRDTKKSIFNYWWKSILSGIKSAYKLDKLPLPKKNGKH